jgi:hypothetical protein
MKIWKIRADNISSIGFNFMKNINYKKLLKKYLDHIGRCNDSQYFLSYYHKDFASFSEEEWQELQNLTKNLKVKKLS